MKKNEIILLLGSVFILTLVWIGFSIHHNSVSSTIPKTLSIQILPITPDFDEKVIGQLKKRQKVTPFTKIQPKATQSKNISTESAKQNIPPADLSDSTTSAQTETIPTQ